MSESIGNKRVFSLFEVANSIRKALADRYKNAYWVKAEMNKLNFYHYSGHCYPDLIEKQKGKVIAQFRSVLWSGDYKRINDQFIKTLHEPLKDGIKILFLANISFDTVYGISLRILDIDASYTLGDLEREKQETIIRLKKEGIYDRNKSLPFPLLPKRIAIVSVETSKGYADFKKIMDNNPWGYKFFHFLFPSLLQGEKAVDSMLNQMQRIRKVIHHFDIVVIIRGGGGEVGLSCYNDYRLAREIALFPIPVLTGIGHATNETVVEMIAFANEITPTKIAEHLIQRFHDFAIPLQKMNERIMERSKRIIREENQNFAAAIKLFHSATGSLMRTSHYNLNMVALSVTQQSLFLFRNKRQSLQYMREKVFDKSLMNISNHKTTLAALEKNIMNMSPESVLKRGYSITLHHGKAVTNTEAIKEGDQLNTRIFGGNIFSVVTATQKSEHDGE